MPGRSSGPLWSYYFSYSQLSCDYSWYGYEYGLAYPYSFQRVPLGASLRTRHALKRFHNCAYGMVR